MVATINADTTNGVIITSDTSGEIELQANGVTKAKVSSSGLTDSSGNRFNTNTHRNLVINGNMSIAQRGTSTAGVTSNHRQLDGYRTVVDNLGTWTIEQSTDAPEGFTKSIKHTCTTADASPAANDYVMPYQGMEGQNLQHLKFGTANAQSITVSFWVKSNKTGTYIASLSNDDNSRYISKSYTISAANTWEKKTITYAGDTVSGFDNDVNRSMTFRWWLAAGSTFTSGTLATAWETATDANKAVGQVNLGDATSNYINFTGLQIEVGSGASDFEHLPYDVQLQRCQRYYEKSYNIDVAPGTVTGNNGAGSIGMYVGGSGITHTSQMYYYKVQKRTNPTITPYNPSTGASGQFSAGTIVITNNGTNSCWFYIDTANPYGHLTAEAEL